MRAGSNNKIPDRPAPTTGPGHAENPALARSPRRRSPRRFRPRIGSQLALIQISLDPPSPPNEPIFDETLDDSPQSKGPYDERKESTSSGYELPPLPPGGGGPNSGSNYYWPGIDYPFPAIESSRLLQVPKGELMDVEMPRQCSPPPRRCSNVSNISNISYTSTTSERSDLSSMSLTGSYQNLLSPYGLRFGSRSSTQSYSADECDTPPEFIDASGSSGGRPYSMIVSLTLLCHMEQVNRL
ncbi:hypothetical protein Ddc_10865 [Ditylenchus destructor]|nr:hypothetical protein Ddc_10865 [Ditylenchus destructor]